MKSLVKKIGVGLMTASPLAAFAAGETLTSATDTIAELIDQVAGIVVALVFIYFLWGLMQYLLGDEKSKDAARAKMVTSILIMFVLFSIWGILRLLQRTLFGTEGGGAAPTVVLPTVR